MRAAATRILLIAAGFALLAGPAPAGTYDAAIKIGAIIFDEEGDLSAVQETQNIYDGFSLSRLYLAGTVDPRNTFRLDLTEANLDSRKGTLLYRMPGVVKFTAAYDQHRQVYDADRAVTSDRNDWRFGLDVGTNKSWLLRTYFNAQQRDGARLGYPDGTASILGDRYENKLLAGGADLEFRPGPWRLAVAYDYSKFTNDLASVTDRTGNVVSVRAFGPCYFAPDRYTHMLRASYGKSEQPDSSLDYELYNFQYTGVLRVIDPVRFKYNLYLNRIDNKSTKLYTDNIQNNFDLVWYTGYGELFGGYGYQLNDDDRSITKYDVYRLGGTLRWQNQVTAKVSYANRTKDDEAKRTLLQDMEAEQVRATLEVKPIDDLVIGGRFIDRRREFPDVGVKSEGSVAGGFANYRMAGWGALAADYTYYDEEYDNLYGRFQTATHAVTGRIDCDYVENLFLRAAVTYLKVEEDLDIEKSILSFEGMYTVADDYHLEIKYNVYNYDDFVVLDRYYTANVVWVNVAWDLHFE
ncbi:MAG: hypothetical protein OER90_09720 [Gemmatimonadota bacterium]|nr:hypothetical protein [Gemmatimonadota bacterium]